MVSGIHDVNGGLFPIGSRPFVLPIALDVIGLAGADTGETVEDVLKAELVDQAFEKVFCFAG
jgi:hypothetical protein